MGVIEEILKKNSIPRMIRAKQIMPNTRIEDVEGAVRKALSDAGVVDRISHGARVGITGGSRGINNILRVYKELVNVVREQGAEPFIFPAMGSHGGATEEGQIDVLKHLGITEQSVGCPILSSMETDLLGFSKRNGLPVYTDRIANRADAVIAVNRIKLHTSFRGPIESGLCKMAVIGMGKQKGAELCHSRGWELMLDSITDLAETVIEKGKIIFGIALVENGYDETAHIACLPSERFMSDEPALLTQARDYMPSIPFKNYDILIVDQIGKEYSGAGMDTNVICRFPSKAIPPDPRQSIVAVLDLSAGSLGNAIGMGLADVTTKRLYEKWDMETSYVNNLTNGTLQNYKLPMVMPNDRMAVQASLQLCRLADSSKAKIVRIENTMQLGELWISEALAEEALASGMVLLSESQEMAFDANGALF